MAITLSILDWFAKFFHSCKGHWSFNKTHYVTYLRSSKEYLTFVKAYYIFGPVFKWSLSTLQLTSGESVTRHVSVRMVDILNTFVNKLLQTICIFYVFLVQVVSAHEARFLQYWCLMVDRPTLLNCKALSLLRSVNEQKVKCWYFA